MPKALQLHFTLTIKEHSEKKLKAGSKSMKVSQSVISNIFSSISALFRILSMIAEVGILGSLDNNFSTSPLGLENIENSSELIINSNFASFLKNRSR